MKRKIVFFTAFGLLMIIISNIFFNENLLEMIRLSLPALGIVGVAVLVSVLMIILPWWEGSLSKLLEGLSKVIFVFGVAILVFSVLTISPLPGGETVVIEDGAEVEIRELDSLVWSFVLSGEVHRIERFKENFLIPFEDGELKVRATYGLKFDSEEVAGIISSKGLRKWQESIRSVTRRGIVSYLNQKHLSPVEGEIIIPPGNFEEALNSWGYETEQIKIKAIKT